MSARWAVVLALLLTAGGARADEPPRLVAHGGGDARGHSVTNSREALDAAVANGFRWIEVDFSTTTDGHLVLLHDWPSVTGDDRVLTLREFREGHAPGELTRMTLADLGVWLVERPGVLIVTDFKKQPLRGIQQIHRDLPELRDRFIPQVYGFVIEPHVRALGFERVILTLYRSGLSEEEMAEIPSHGFVAVTMPLRLATPDVLAPLQAAGVFVYVHTVNDTEQLRQLRSLGVDGVYTDRLLPGGVP
jgi:glycerophosphoryl diester phosphodiesterase